MSDIESLVRDALADIERTDSLDALQALRVALLGKSGSITAQLKRLGKLAPDERKAAGAAINRGKARVAAGAGRAPRGPAGGRAGRSAWPPSASTSRCPGAMVRAAACTR